MLASKKIFLKLAGPVSKSDKHPSLVQIFVYNDVTNYIIGRGNGEPCNKNKNNFNFLRPFKGETQFNQKVSPKSLFYCITSFQISLWTYKFAIQNLSYTGTNVLKHLTAVSYEFSY